MVSVSQLFITLLNIQIHQVLRSNKSSKLNNVDFFQTDWTSRKRDAKRRLIMFRPHIPVRTSAVNDPISAIMRHPHSRITHYRVHAKTHAEPDCCLLFILSSLSYLILIFTHLKLCLAAAIHHFKWVIIIQI